MSNSEMPRFPDTSAIDGLSLNQVQTTYMRALYVGAVLAEGNPHLIDAWSRVIALEPSYHAPPSSAPDTLWQLDALSGPLAIEKRNRVLDFRLYVSRHMGPDLNISSVNPIIFQQHTSETRLNVQGPAEETSVTSSLSLSRLALGWIRYDTRGIQHRTKTDSTFRKLVLDGERTGVASVDHVTNLMYQNALLGYYDEPLTRLQLAWEGNPVDPFADSFYSKEFQEAQGKVGIIEGLVARFSHKRRYHDHLWRLMRDDVDGPIVERL